VEIEHPASAFRGSTVDFLLKIRNTGWSRLHDGKNLKLFLVRSDGAGDAMIDAAAIKPGFFEPKLPTEAPDSLAFSVKLPSQLAAGAWRVAISLRDAAGSLDDDPRYALRFANADNLSSGQHWDNTHGAFFTG